jgi:hypothetical protein
MLLQVHPQERVFIALADPQKGLTLHLRTRLRNAGVSAFVDEQELLPGAQHQRRRQACRQLLRRHSWWGS